MSKETYYIWSVVLTVIGLALGGVYFCWRIRYEERRDKKKRRQDRIKDILDIYAKAHEHALLIFIGVKDDCELKLQRGKLSYIGDCLQNVLEHNDKLLGLSLKDLRVLLTPFSKYEKSGLGTYDFQKIIAHHELLIKSWTEFQDQLAKARLVCLDYLD